ncbi:MAG: hypothetical protein Q8R82_14170 [Hyphomonadaceae bacterium]|nr:hypothetical protein [Hyphomonadaceae bacterium]
MTPQSVGDWIAWAGLVLPLATLAFSAVWFVASQAQKSKAERYARFWELMKQAGAQDANIAAKMATFYELRKYPEYKEVIIRLCEEAQVSGSSGELLKKEMLLTAAHMRAPSA